MKRTLTTALLILTVGSAAFAGTPPHWAPKPKPAMPAQVAPRIKSDPRDQGHSNAGADWKRSAPRVTEQPPRVASPAMNNPPLRVASLNDRGERRGFNDPRPNVNWQSDRSGSDRNQNARRDWDRHDWQDRNGRDWRRDRSWYEQYRYRNYRFVNDRFYARQRFSFGVYFFPYGYGPRTWARGEFLPFAYFSDRYSLYDFDRFDLYDPPIGCRWMRVGDDALLIDIGSGYVLDSVYNEFW